jgi:hypothetical protein
MTYQVDLKIEINKVVVNDYDFSFKYKVFINKKLKYKGTYEDTHSRLEDKDTFKKILETGWSAQLILETIKL